MIRLTNYTQHEGKTVKPADIPGYWWLMLAWFTMVAMTVLANLLGLIGDSPPHDQVQDTRPQTVYAGPPGALRSHPAERKVTSQSASRDRERESPARSAPSPTPTPAPERSSGQGKPAARSGVGLPPLLELIRSHESGGNYSAYNAGGCEGYGCGGAYQLHARYAPAWAASAGYPGMGPNAAAWPPATQDAVALWLFQSTSPDGTHWCRWTDYC